MPGKSTDSGFDAVAVGYTAVDCLGRVPCLPDRNTKLEIDSFLMEGGGPAATASVTLSRLGLRTAFAGKVGGDLLGSFMLERLAAEGVDTSAVVVEADAASQFAFIMVDGENGDRTILWTRGTLSPMLPEEVDTALVAGARGLLIDSLEPAAALAAAMAAKENGVKVVIDAGTLREGVAELLPFCDFIVGSELFASQVSGGGDVGRALSAMMEYGPEAAVVTLGERGCAFLEGGAVRTVEPFDVKAVDTTGAGDVFHGAFLAGILAGFDLYGTCLFSNAVAAMKCLEAGGRAGIPGFDETLRFIAGKRPEEAARLSGARG